MTEKQEVSEQKVVCPRCQGPLVWYARGRRAYCPTCIATVIELPRRKFQPTHYAPATVKPMKPMDKVYERLWYNGKLIFEGEVDPREPVIPIEYTAVKSGNEVHA